MVNRLLKQLAERYTLKTTPDVATTVEQGLMQLSSGIYTEEELKVSKSTGPDVYDASLEFLGGTKENTAVFEDTLSCIRICKKNGYYTVAIAESLTPPEYLAEIKPLADRYIQSYKEMIH